LIQNAQVSNKEKQEAFEKIQKIDEDLNEKMLKIMKIKKKELKGTLMEEVSSCKKSTK